MCPYVYILRVYVLYDYVQRCQDTVSVELRYINQIYYCFIEDTVFITIVVVIIIIIIPG